MNTRLDPQNILQVILQQLEAAELMATGNISLYNPDDDTLVLESFMGTHNMVAKELNLQQGTAIAVEFFGVRATIDGKMTYIPDLESQSNPLYKMITEQGFHSLLAIPIQTVQTTRVLFATRHEKDGFNQTDRAFFEQLGKHVAHSMQYAELYQKLDEAYAELKQTQQAIMSQERLRALGQMASGVAHDINNALVPIVGFTDLMLLRANNLSEQDQRYLEHIRTSAADITEIVNRMRQFYRKRNVQDQFKAVSLNTIVHEVIELTSPRWKNMPEREGIAINIKTDTDDNLPGIAGVESELREALTNLIINAIDAMPQGGQITVQTRHTSEIVRLEITDTGAGMDEKTRQRCLEPFFTTKGEAGTGLGLAMVFGIVKRHDATLDIESTPGKGTTIRIDFPAAGLLTIEKDTEDNHPDAETIPSLKILCIDDNHATLELLQEMLTLDGHTVTTIDGGQAGLDEFRDSINRGEPFDVVFTDLGMPYVDGRQVINTIKRESPDTPVILLTGWGARFTSEENIPPTDVILNKPPQVNDIQRGLRKIFLPSDTVAE